jgi:hypothetical protein
MRKLLLKSTLLLCAIIAGSMNIWAEDVEIFNVAGGGKAPTGWTLNADNKNDYWLLHAVNTDYIQTSAYNVSAYDKVTITAQVATYGSGQNPHARIEISYDGGTTFNEVTIQGDPTSSTYVNISYDLLCKSSSVVIKISNSISSGRGLRVKNIVLTGTIKKADAGLLATEDFDMIRDTEKNAEDLFTIISTGSVSYESSNEDVAKVVDGKLKALAVGTATITISSAANNDYNAGSDAVIVTVKNRDAVAPEGAEIGDFTKITSTAELTDGEYLIVCETENVAFNGNLTTLDATNNYINVTISSNNTIASTPETNNAIFTYNSTVKTLRSKSGKYIGRTTDSNGLDAGTTALTNNISFLGIGDAVIESPKGPALQYDNNSGQKRFSYFKGTKKYVQLFKRSTVTTYDITIGSTGYKTLISSINATLPTDVFAYKAISTDEGKILLTSVASIKAGSAYVLKGAVGNHTLTMANTPEEPTGNILEVSDENASNGVYVLANGSQGVGFYKWTGGSLGAGRAIVPASAVNSTARGFLGFDFEEEANTIKNVKALQTDCIYYNLAGQRVAQPTKGLYIVKGKKVIVK